MQRNPTACAAQNVSRGLEDRKEAYTVVLWHEGGTVAFKPGIEAAIAELKRLLKYDPSEEYWPRIGGHFFRSDLPWLKHEGLDPLHEYAPPNTWQEAKYCGGWDTAHMVHAHNETANFGLTDVLVRWTSIPVYEVLKKHVAAYCKARDMKKEALMGYGFMLKWILHPEFTYPEGDWPYACLAKGAAIGWQLGNGR